MAADQELSQQLCALMDHWIVQRTDAGVVSMSVALTMLETLALTNRMMLQAIVDANDAAEREGKELAETDYWRCRLCHNAMPMAQAMQGRCCYTPRKDGCLLPPDDESFAKTCARIKTLLKDDPNGGQ